MASPEPKHLNNSGPYPLIPKKIQWKYKDPNEEISRKGLLLSNKIERFCNERLLIDDEYDIRHLRPAAYTLGIGIDYVDSRGRETQANRSRTFIL